jgi:MFS transporter, DHA3 family, macrolide efflux protein
VLIGGIIIGLLFGLLVGGRLSNLASIQLRWSWLLLAAVVVRFGTEFLLNAQVEIVESLRVPLLAAGFGILLAGLWINRTYPGLSVAFIGILLNAIVIVVNGGFMPIWAVSLDAAGFKPEDVTGALHVIVRGEGADFLTKALIIGDVIPVPLPLIRNVASLGDVFLSLGLAFFLFAGVVRVPTRLEEREEDAARDRSPRSGLLPGLRDAAALQRPLILGGQAARLASPNRATLTAATPEVDVGTAPTITLPRPSPETLERVRRHPYVRLALNGSFTALWAGQLISLFGDRLHQVALAVTVLVMTGSPLATALIFVAATLPTLFFSPIAGTLVDRWDHKEVMVVSDLLRGAVVLLIPIAVVTNIVLVYPLVFLLTSISIFFRPARIAILPRIVRDDELLTANSALWVGETMADVIGYPLAGLFVAALATALPTAFWLDAATYIASAALLSTVVVRSLDAERDGAPATGARAAAAADIAGEDAHGLFGEMKVGWRFLRREPVLLANTLQATVAQLTVGVMIGLTPVYAQDVFGHLAVGWQAVYAFLETGIGLGNLVGGFLIGLIGLRFAKGKMVIAGYTAWGLLTFGLAMTGNLGLALGIAFGSGVSNMVFVIPSQTLFQERTPQALIGRVVGLRFALVFGAMNLSIALGGVLAEVVGVTPVIAVFGLITAGAGIAGLFFPAVRDA